ncbi:MAG: LamG domain-containing protein [Lentisphaeria bacterium]|nr:LamG domain-containing protein [Lentisphaeria bacterium]
MKKRILSLLAAGMLFPLSAELPKPVIHATFDRDFRAETPKGTIQGKHSVPLNMETLSVLLQDGVKGKAARIGAETVNGKTKADYIHYPAKGLDPKKGTIAFWLKPLDWSFKDPKFHVFCEAKGDNSVLIIYKYNIGRFPAFIFGKLNSGKSQRWMLARTPQPKWETGEFHHLAFTWDQDCLRIYIDGLQKGMIKNVKELMPTNFHTLSVGPYGPNLWRDHDGNSLIDDFRVYDKTLSGSEIEQLYTSYGVAKIDKSKIPVTITTSKMLSTPDKKEIHLDFTLSRTDSKSHSFPVEMEVSHDGKTVLKTVLRSKSLEYRYVFDLAKWKKGDYRITLKPLREKPQDIVEGRTLFLTLSDYAPVVDHSVPAPWKPVEFKNNQFSALMQKTVFGNGLFPGQLFSQKIPLLRGDMQFIWNGKAVSGKAVSEITEKHPDYQVLERKVAGNGFDLVSRCRFEFDGMMWFEVTLIPKGKVQVRNAKIQLPFRKETSTLYNCFVRDYFSMSGHFAGKLTKTVKRNHFDTSSDGKLPVLWMGNEERGLYYFTEDQAGRRLKNREETVRLDPGKDGALFTINLIDYECTLDKPVTWSFGLHVTPSRPFERNRRLWRGGSYYRPEVNSVLWYPWAKIHNVPEARFKKDDFEPMRKARAGKRNIPVFFYFAGFSASPENPAYPQHAHEWSITPPVVGTEASVNNREWRYVFICTKSPTYRSYYLRNFEKCIRELKMDHLYFDNDLSYYCSNPAHGCGWKDEHGKLYRTSSVLGARELAKGIYRIHKKLYPEGKIVRHLTQTPEMPQVSFCNATIDGESFIVNVGKDENYYNIFTPDYYRASFMGRPFGVPNVFIPQFQRAYGLHYPEKYKAARAGKLKNQNLHIRHYMGYVFVHDSDMWLSYGVTPQPFWKIMDQAGITENSAFWGYWQKDNPVRKVSPANEKVMVSSYAAKDGVLAVLLNDTDDAVSVKLNLDSGMLGKSPKCFNAENGQQINPDSVTLPAREFRMIRIKK